MKKLTIITICFNSDKTIERTVQSVCNQKNSELEYIIIDGKSTDSTLEILEKYNSNIDKIISEKDEGIYDAYNKGIENASGDFVMFLNSDDWLESSAISKIFSSINIKDDIYYSAINIFDENQKFIRKKKAKRNLIPLWLAMPYAFPTMIFKRKLLEDIGGFDTSFATISDYDLVIRLIKSKLNFIEIEGPTVNFSRGGISDYGNDTNQRKMLFKKHNLGTIQLHMNVSLNNFFKFKKIYADKNN